MNLLRPAAKPAGRLPTFCFFLVALAVCVGAETPIKLHPDNPHYFLYKGKPTVLITSGEHYGSVLNLNFDYVAYLDELKRRGFNQTRTFTGTYKEGGTSGHGPSPLSPGAGRRNFITPWAWGDVPGGADGVKFDLGRWNGAYFDRLKDFCRKAEERGVIVELVLFSRMYSDDRWKLSPLHPDNNLQGDAWRELNYTRTLTPDSPALLARQKAVVRKIVTELRGVPNVYFEIANEPAQREIGGEFGKAVHAWHEEIIAEIVAAEASLPPDERHIIAYNADYGSRQGIGPVPSPASVSVINIHYLDRSARLLAEYGGGKALGFDETRWIAHPRFPEYKNAMKPASGRVEAWEFVLGGGAVYSNLNHAYQVNNPAGKSPESDEFKGYLGKLKQFLEELDFVKMRQDKGVLAEGLTANSAWRGISEPGRQYAIYIHHSSLQEGRRYLVGEEARTIEPVLDLPRGTYKVEWVRPTDLAVLKTQRLAGHAGGRVRLEASPRHEADIALRITSER